MPKYGYVVVEGPHDVEFVCQLLGPRRLRRVQFEKDFDPFFHRLIPHSYPPNGDLLKRVPVPLFLQNDTHAVAIHTARRGRHSISSDTGREFGRPRYCEAWRNRDHSRFGLAYSRHMTGLALPSVRALRDFLIELLEF